MPQLFYSLRYLLRGKGNNIIKVISLTLGLVVSLVLFSKVAFEMSYDRFSPDADRMYRIQMKISDKDGVRDEGPRMYYPVARDLQANLSEIENSTVVSLSISEEYLQFEDKIFNERVLPADANFFDFFGIRLIAGNKELLDIPDNIFISQSTAKKNVR